MRISSGWNSLNVASISSGRITVRARRDGDRVVIEVLDTGVGEAAGASHGNGFGLTQIRERLLALHGERAVLDFQRDGAGAHARITLPIA